MKSETVYKCCKCNSGRYCSRDCQRILESSEQEKLKRYSKDYSVLTMRHALPNFKISLLKLLKRDPL